MENSEVVAIVAGDPGRPRQRGQGQGWGVLADARKEEAWASEVGAFKEERRIWRRRWEGGGCFHPSGP